MASACMGREKGSIWMIRASRTANPNRKSTKRDRQWSGFLVLRNLTFCQWLGPSPKGSMSPKMSLVENLHWQTGMFYLLICFELYPHGEYIYKHCGFPEFQMKAKTLKSPSSWSFVPKGLVVQFWIVDGKIKQLLKWLFSKTMCHLVWEFDVQRKTIAKHFTGEPKLFNYST